MGKITKTLDESCFDFRDVAHHRRTCDLKCNGDRWCKTCDVFPLLNNLVNLNKRHIENIFKTSFKRL